MVSGNISMPSMATVPAIECIRVKIAAAVYSITDMVVFEVYKKISEDTYYLVATLQENEFNEKVAVFQWEDIPTDIMDIYDYVTATSVLEQKDDTCILYGTHIGRRNNHKYILAQYLKHPCQEDTLQLLATHKDVTDNDKELMEFYSEICQNMKIVKNLM